MPVNRSATTKAMVEGAIAASLATILAVLGYYLPPLSMLFALVWFIPIVVVIVRQDLRWGVMSLTVAAILLMMLTNPLRGFIVVVQSGFVSLVYGYGFKNQWSPGRTILLGGLVVICSTLAALGLTVAVMGINIFELQGELTQQVEGAIEVYRNMGLIDAGISEQELRETMATYVQFLTMLIPGVLVTGSLLTALVNFLLVRLVLKRMGEKVRSIPPFRQWQLPWYLIWGIIGGLGLLLVGDYYDYQLLKTIGINIIYIYFPIMLLVGLAVVTHFYHHLKLSRMVKIIIGVVLLINLPFAVLLIASIGLFDPLLNYRRLGKDLKKESEEK